MRPQAGCNLDIVRNVNSNEPAIRISLSADAKYMGISLSVNRHAQLPLSNYYKQGESVFSMNEVDVFIKRLMKSLKINALSILTRAPTEEELKRGVSSIAVFSWRQVPLNFIEIEAPNSISFSISFKESSSLEQRCKELSKFLQSNLEYSAEGYLHIVE